RPRGRDGAQEPDGRQPARLLRTCRKRPRRGRDAEQRDERAPAAHSITSSARPSSVSGKVMPIALAAFRLIISQGPLVFDGSARAREDMPIRGAPSRPPGLIPLIEIQQKSESLVQQVFVAGGSAQFNRS